MCHKDARREGGRGSITNDIESENSGFVICFSYIHLIIVGKRLWARVLIAIMDGDMSWVY